MKHVLQLLVFIAGFLLLTTPVLASPTVDQMSNIEISEYAVRMAEVMEKIQTQQLCESCDIKCERAEFSRHGISYDDKELVRKRLALMVGRLY